MNNSESKDTEFTERRKNTRLKTRHYKEDLAG